MFLFQEILMRLVPYELFWRSRGTPCSTFFTVRPIHGKHLVVKIKTDQYMHTLFVPVFEHEEL